jgi:hypothetical protein
MPEDNASQPPSRPSPRYNRGADSARSKYVRPALRLGAVAVVALVAALLYRGLHDRFFLPECDSDRAKRTLSDILGQLKLEPSRYEPLTTVSSSKTQVVCNAVLPLTDGGKAVIDYTFYWQGSQANMKYSVARQ